MIEEGSGNLLTQDVDALVNTVNTVGVMGKGIALQFKRAFPANYRAYRAAVDRDHVRTGSMFVYDSGQLGPRRFIINFPTKRHWRSRSSLEDVAAGLEDLVSTVRRLQIGSLAVPALGCGNGGLDWAVVRPLIEKAFTDLPDVRVLLFPPAGAPAASEMPVATPKPRLTLNRAALVLVLTRYLERARALAPREGVSELETQKLTYLLQVLGQPSALTFVRARYGPYAEQLHHVLQQLEGHYLIGYGDRTARVSELQPLQVLDGATGDAAAWLDEHAPEVDERISRLLRLVDGFETPYSLELLATAHFAAHSEPVAGTAADVVNRVAGWSPRKARLFTPPHVQLALARLGQEDLLPRDWAARPTGAGEDG
jgi:O-acetyl-ADP-ribose deacetylase (regulator of RNase III)